MARDRASRPEAKPLRLFVAFDVPHDVRTSLADAIAPLREQLPGRWPPPENWHLTLKFLGSTWPRLVEWVKESCREVTPEKRAFTPHLTVARFQPQVAVGEALAGLEVESRAFDVDRIVLYRSHLGRPAPRYEPLEEFPLGL